MTETQPITIAPAALFALLNAGEALDLLDVRTPPEFASAHVSGAKLVPLGDLDVHAVLQHHETGKPMYMLCQAGQRASKAIEQFERAGCNDCVLVEGGTQAWIDAGLPVDRGESKVLPLNRQVQITVGAISATGALLALLVSSWFALLPLFTGCGLLFAGLTGTCGMALLLAKMPWNRMKTECATTCCIPENQ